MFVSRPDASLLTLSFGAGPWAMLAVGGYRLGEIAVPSLLLHGTADAVMPPESSRDLSAAIAGSRLVMLDGLGHAPMLSRPDLVAAEIETFFGEILVR